MLGGNVPGIGGGAVATSIRENRHLVHSAVLSSTVREEGIFRIFYENSRAFLQSVFMDALGFSAKSWVFMEARVHRMASVHGEHGH